MQLIDTITIYERVGDAYKRVIVNNVYWYGVENRRREGNGAVSGFNYRVVFTDIEAYKRTGLKLGDIAVKGVGSEIVMKRDLDGYKMFEIMGIEENIVGSAIDHVVIYGN